MHPAFSVIFFTVLSGAGYGLWFWIGLRCLSGPHPRDFGAWAWIPAWALGFVLIVIGLLSSTAHLGKPLRSWRAFSQWRTSWLSREGVMALVTFVPAILTMFFLYKDAPAPESIPLRIVAGILCVCCLITIYCTAKIYHSLPTIPEWNHPLVPWSYAFAALASGGLLTAVMIAAQQQPAQLHMMVFFTPCIIAFGIVKWLYWRGIDAKDVRPSLGSAVGMPDRELSVFERPNTEPNYLNKEMGYRVARKHAAKLRVIAMVLAVIVPLLAFATVLVMARNGYLFSPMTALVHLVGAISCITGLLVERWLFFAQARHTVDRYYRG